MESVLYVILQYFFRLEFMSWFNCVKYTNYLFTFLLVVDLFAVNKSSYVDSAAKLQTMPSWGFA